MRLEINRVIIYHCGCRFKEKVEVDEVPYMDGTDLWQRKEPLEHEQLKELNLIGQHKRNSKKSK